MEEDFPQELSKKESDLLKFVFELVTLFLSESPIKDTAAEETIWSLYGDNEDGFIPLDCAIGIIVNLVGQLSELVGQDPLVCWQKVILKLNSILPINPV